MFHIVQTLLDDSSFKSEVKFSTRKFNANEKILEQGKPHRSLYLIKKGTVRVSVSGDMKENQLVHPGLADLGPNDIFGEFGLYDEEPANADVRAITDSELVEIDITSFREFLQTRPQIGYKILEAMLKTLIKRLRHADEAIIKLYVWGLKMHQLDKHLHEKSAEAKESNEQK